MSESDFQAHLIKRLRRMFPGCKSRRCSLPECVILKNDAGYLQGIPDLSIFYGDRYAFLEVKAGEDSPHQVNQDYYVRTLNEMSFARFIYPSNQEQVLNELSRSLAPGGHTCSSKR